MRVYLAARYNRRAEMAAHKELLQVYGHEVVSTWTEETVLIPSDGDTRELFTLLQEEHCDIACNDLDEIRGCDQLLAFTDSPNDAHIRGGRHIEAGYAMGLGISVSVIGEIENIFYSICMQYPNLEDWIDEHQGH